MARDNTCGSYAGSNSWAHNVVVPVYERAISTIAGELKDIQNIGAGQTMEGALAATMLDAVSNMEYCSSDSPEPNFDHVDRPHDHYDPRIQWQCWRG
jgi:hypothetical protein